MMLANPLRTARGDAPANDALVIDYAAGALGPAAALLAATHCAMSAQARARLSACEAVGGALLDGGPRAVIADGALASVLARLDAPAPAAPAAPAPERRSAMTDLPAPLARAVGCGLSELRWRMVMPGMREHALDVGADEGVEAKLIKLAAGRSIPRHTHDGLELTLVLTGVYEDESGRYPPGAVAVADGDIEHQPRAGENETCVCFSVAAGGYRIRRPLVEFVRCLFG